MELGDRVGGGQIARDWSTSFQEPAKLGTTKESVWSRCPKVGRVARDWSTSFFRNQLRCYSRGWFFPLLKRLQLSPFFSVRCQLSLGRRKKMLGRLLVFEECGKE